MDRITELHELALAERHIEQGSVRMAKMRACIERASALGISTSLAESVLATMEGSMSVFQTHRLTIIQTLHDIDSGALPRQRR